MPSEEQREFLKTRQDSEAWEAFDALPMTQRAALRHRPETARKRGGEVKERDPHDYS